MFNFALSNGAILSLYGFEVCPLVDLQKDLIVSMNKKIDKYFKMLLYYDEGGYYVLGHNDNKVDKRTGYKFGKIKYYVYDSFNDEFTGYVFDSLREIPSRIDNKNVFKFRKKVIINEF